MGFLPFLKVLLRDQRSHKATAVGSILGIMISVGFITASFMTTEMTLTELFQDEMETVRYHFIADQYLNRGGEVQNVSSQKAMMQRLNELPGISDCGLFKKFERFQINHFNLNIYGLDKGASRLLFKNDGIVLPKDGKSAAISDVMAENLGLYIGNNINITYYKRGNYSIDNYGTIIGTVVAVNISIIISNIIELPSQNRVLSTNEPFKWNLFMGLKGVEILVDEYVNESGFNPSFLIDPGQIFIKVDPNHFTNEDDVLLYKREITQLKNEIYKIIGPEGYSISTDNIDGIYENYVFNSITLRVFLVIFSFPLFLLCFYLVLVGSRTGMENKVQEISLLKVKGATKGQIFWMLFVESLFHGVLGALFGIALGAFLSLCFIDLFRGSSVGFFSMFPGGAMVLTLLLISCVLVSLIRLRSMLRLSKMDILQAVKGSPERKEKIYNPTFDLIVIAIMAFFLGVTMFFKANRPEGTFQLVLYSIKEVASPLLIILLPFLLILSLSRVMVLWVPQTISLVSKLFRGMNKELHSLLVSGMRFRKRQVAIMTILIAITISFGTLVLSQKETRTNGMEVSLYSSVPSDLLVVSNGGTTNEAVNISSIEGVESVAMAGFFYEMSYSYRGNDKDREYAEIIEFDVNKYLKIVNSNDDLFLKGNGLKGLSERNDTPPVILNRFAADDSAVTIGDHITIYLGNFGIINCSVIGIVDHLPGLRTGLSRDIFYHGMNGNGMNNIDLINLHEGPAIYISIDNIDNVFYPAIWSYLVDIDGNKSSIMENIYSIDLPVGPPVIVDRENALKGLKNEPIAEGIDLILMVQFFFVLITVMMGVFILQFIQNNSRKREFAEVISRGAMKGNIFRLLLSEGLVVLILGLVIGSLTGFIVGYAFQTVFTGDWVSSIGDLGSNINTENRITLNNGVIFPPTLFLLHLVTTLSMLIAIVIAAFMSSRINIASSLRLRRS